MANPDFVEDEFEGAGLKPGLEVWYIDDNVKPVRVPESYHGVFFSGCAYVLLRTHESDGSLSHDICCWLGEDLSQAQVESIKVTVLALHGALKYETTPSWMKQSEGCAGLFTNFGVQCMIFRIGRFIPDAEMRNSFLYVWIAHNNIRQEVVRDRASLSNDCIFVLDTATKIFLFNCPEPVMEGPKKLVQRIKDTFHDGNCEMAVIGDGTLMTDGDTKEFWDFFGGYGPLPSNFSTKNFRGRLFCVVNGHATPMEVKLMKRDLLDTHKCYVVDSGMEVYVWMGIKSSLQERNSASAAAKHLLCSFRRPKSNIVRVIEESERLHFRMLFDYWPVSKRSGEVAGVNVKELLEAPSSKEDCNGILQVWRLDGDTKSPLMGADKSKFYSGDCYIFLYAYHGELGEEHFVGTWFGQQSLEAIARKVLKKGSLYRWCLPLGSNNFEDTEIECFDLDTLQTGGIFILDLQLDIYVWVGLEARSLHMDALTIAKEYLGKDDHTPKENFSIFIIMEGSEPDFFRRMFERPVVKTALQLVNYRERLQPMSEALIDVIDPDHYFLCF